MNKEIGTKFEKEFCEFLARRGYWAVFIQPNSCGGQPFDVVAGKDNEIFAFDCKTCEKKYLSIGRLEFNQIVAFTLFLKKGNKNAFLAVKHDGKIYKIPFILLEKQSKVYLTDEFLFE